MPTLRQARKQGTIGPDPSEIPELWPWEEDYLAKYGELPKKAGKLSEVPLRSPGVEIETSEGYGYFGAPEAGVEALRTAKREPKGVEEIWTETGKGLTGKAKEIYEQKMRQRIQATRPPEDFAAPDFSPTGEKRFEQHIFNNIEQMFKIPGGNPFLYDPNQEVQEADAMLPEIFNKFFQGRVTWADRDRLSKDQAEAWNDVVKGFHAYTHDQAINNQKRAIEAYKWMKGKWDEQKKMQEAARKEFRAEKWKRERAAQAEQWRREREERKAIKPPKVKEPTRSDIQAIYKAEEELLELKPDSPEFKHRLKAINGMRKAAGLPPLTKKIVQKGKKRTLFGIDILMPDIKEKVEYAAEYGAAAATPERETRAIPGIGTFERTEEGWQRIE